MAKLYRITEKTISIITLDDTNVFVTTHNTNFTKRAKISNMHITNVSLSFLYKNRIFIEATRDFCCVV